MRAQVRPPRAAAVAPPEQPARIAQPIKQVRPVREETGQILIVNVNLTGNSLCESDLPQVVQNNRTTLPARLKYTQECNLPDFMSRGLRDKVKGKLIVLFVTTQESNSNTYFHSDYLPAFMKQEGFLLYHRGRTSNQTSIRMSVYITAIDAAVYATISKQIFKAFSVVSETQIGDKGKSVVIYMRILGSLYCFIALDIDEDYKSMSSMISSGDVLIRKDEVMKKTVVLNRAIRYFGLEVSELPDHVFIIGTLNYRLGPGITGAKVDTPDILSKIISSSRNNLGDVYRKHDELKGVLEAGLTYNVEEGINNAGPNYLPSCDRMLGRNVNCAPDGCPDSYDTTIYPGWCSRILHIDQKGAGNIICNEYSSLDIGGTIQTRFRESLVYAVYGFRE